MKKLITIIIIIICVSLFAQYDPKNVGIYIMLPNSQVPEDGTITFTATIQGESYTVDQDDVGCGYKALSTVGLCYVNMASFGYAWSQGDVINWTVTETESREELGNVNQTLATGDGTSQYDTDYWDDGFFLPVTLSSFTAVYQEGMPILQWITQSENNNSGWNIFRSESEDMELSMQINPELITGAGTTTEIQNYSFTDEYEIESGVTYFYQLESVDFLGLTEQFGPISIRIPDDGQGESPEVPVVYGLHNNYPNPFNPETMISFTPEVEGQVTIDILNIKGQIVKNLVKETIENNEIDILHSYIWDGSNNHGKYVSSGVYFYRYQSPKRIQINKMLMIK